MSAEIVATTGGPRLDPPPPGAWFRKRWRTGKTGQWHRAVSASVPDDGRGPYWHCSCPMSSGYTAGQNVTFTDWTNDPDDEPRCKASGR